jgi:hypothetical protein
MGRGIAVAIFIASTAAAADDWELRPSLAFGPAWPFASREGLDPQMGSSQAALSLELTVEYGPIFGGVVWLHGLGEGVVPDQSFIGPKIGAVVPGWPIAPYASMAVGSLSQTVLIAVDECEVVSASGIAFMPEVGIAIGRRQGLMRGWVYAFALLPTFGIPNRTAQWPEIRSFGFGLRLGL